MKISLDWLKDYIDIKISAVDLAHRLTVSGLEVEKQERLAGDTVFELEITPNRPDCLSILGVARELSAILNVPLKKPVVKKIKFPKTKASITIEDKKDCSRYIGAIFMDVNITPSPVAMQKKLNAVGLRSVNNIVDITNFCLMELGQPMHAFDLDKLEGRKIIVRRAKQGEKIVAINDVEYTLDSSVLVIADERKAVAIAGIMGGKQTEVTEKTKNIFLESAYFDPILVRQASRKLGLRSDASYRFERGVDNAMVETACWRATSLIKELTVGKPVALQDVRAKTYQRNPLRSIQIDVDRLSGFLGIPLTKARVKNILSHLEFDITSKGKKMLSLQPPSFRLDIKTDVDVAEEIGRISGFDNLATRLMTVNPTNIPTSTTWKFKDQLSQRLVGLGLSEIIAYALIGKKDLHRSGFSVDHILCNQNPLSEEQEVLRPSSLPSMLKIVSHNIKNGQKNLRLFELGRIYQPQKEEEILSLAFTGRRAHDWREGQAPEMDFYDLKGLCEHVFGFCGLRNIRFEKKAQLFLDPSQSAVIYSGSCEIGWLGKIPRSVLEQHDIKHQDLYCAQCHLEALWRAFDSKKTHYTPLSAYPGIGRDVSLALPIHISYQQVYNAIISLQETLLQQVSVVEMYRGEKIPPGYQGITLSLFYQSRERTLTEQEAEAAHQRICEKIIKDVGAIKR